MNKTSQSFKKVEPYNYKRPDRISKNQLRSLRFIHDRFARNVSSAISAYLRKVVEISLDKIQQSTYAEFLSKTSDPTSYSALSLQPLEGSAALEVTPPAVYSILDRLMGGPGNPLEMDRPMTEIEQKVLHKVLNMFLEHLKTAWRQIYPVEFQITATETQPQMIQVVAPNDMVVVFAFKMRMKEEMSHINLAFSTIALEPIIHIFDKEWSSSKKTKVGSTMPSQVVKVPLKVSIETTETFFPFRSIAMLQEGDTLVLDQRKESPVVLRVGGKSTLRATARLEASRKTFEIVQTAEKEAANGVFA